MKLSKHEDKDLPPGFLHIDRDLGRAYMEDMNFMLQYALDNRLIMMDIVLDILGADKSVIKQEPSYNNGVHVGLINETHNHATIDGNLVLHRKGATPSELNHLGVIPGNMRDGVFVTRGLGNKDYLESSSHGAGRVMSRKQAKKSLILEDVKEQMEGIVGNVSEKTLDEAPDAYKDINEVIRLQNGIVVEVINFIRPLINVKG